MEKLACALILASRKLRPYFQVHRVEVRTSFPLRTAIKGQALADFFLEFPSSCEVSGNECATESTPTEIPTENCSPWWTLYVDGAVNGNGTGSGIVLVSPEGHKLQSSIHFGFKATNNDAKYEALIAGLKLALEMKVENLNMFSDSMLVVGHIKGGFQARGPRTDLYMRHAQELMGKFKEVNLEQIPRAQNADADALAKLGSQREATLLGVIPLEIQKQPSIFQAEVMGVEIQREESWVTPILDYITKGTLPADKDEARRVKYRATRYVIYNENLYKRGFNRPLLRCVAGDECDYIMREVHGGICGNHAGGTSLAHKILRQGYYWPTLKKDAHEFARACDRCQRFANLNSNPVVPLKQITSPWPFTVWGIDLIGELPKGKGGVKYAVVAVDYFTMWAEAEPLATITAAKLKEFVFRAIIQKGFSAVCHPQSNGQTKAVNKIIKHTLKAKLEEKKGYWPEELPMVLWSYNTTPRTTTGESPFTLAYGCEAMVPVEIGSGSFRRDNYNPTDNEVNHRLYLDLVEEVRATSQLKLAAYQQRTRKYFDKKVRARPLQVWDLVLRKSSPYV
ncbi:uncharacterized protein LOC141665314 [Apium graveolens]|uniref:uncharacterized protein LOC141665314 n=1 Tax=Apium graveolens TaxID=4045 RepID=UPI003D7BD419